jgi:hypothetical protein
MEAALAQLREARASLERAEHNKGGWRAKAIEAADSLSPCSEAWEEHSQCGRLQSRPSVGRGRI